MTTEERIKVWELIYGLVKDLPYVERVQAIQRYVQEGGPIPNVLGEKFRALLTPTT